MVVKYLDRPRIYYSLQVLVVAGSWMAAFRFYYWNAIVLDSFSPLKNVINLKTN
jgi:hypothetical protein